MVGVKNKKSINSFGQGGSFGLKKIITFVLCAIPILCIYRCWNYFMLGEAIVLVLLLIALFDCKDKAIIVSKKQVAIFGFAVSILLISCVGYFLNSIELAAFIRLIRLLFNLIAVLLLGGLYFDYKVAKKYLTFIACVATVAIIVQKLYHDFTGNYVYFLAKNKIYSSIYNTDYFKNVESLSTFRPMGIFLEPSHYSQYILFVIAIKLLQFKVSIKDVGFSVFFTVGILMSTSSTGVILCVLMWFLYFFRVFNVFVGGVLNAKSIAILIIAVVAGFFVLQRLRGRLEFAIDRVYDANSSGTTSAWDGRLSTFSVFFENNSLVQTLFGRGYGVINEAEWYASVPYYYSGTGAFGMIAIVIYFISLYGWSNKLQKKLLVLFFILCFVTEVLTNYWILFIVSLIMNATDCSEKKVKNE